MYILEWRELTIDELIPDSEGYGLWSVEKKILSGNHSCLSERFVLLGEAPQVPRNQAGLSDIAKLQHQHDRMLETNASSTMWGQPHLKPLR